MSTIGGDAHTQGHAAVALDGTGRAGGQWRGTNTARGWGELQQRAAGLGAARQWGIEGAWKYGRGLAQHLVAAGAHVDEVNPRWTADGRRRARRPGKTDALDAHAVARLVLRETATLPQGSAEDDTARLDLLVTERETAGAEATRLRNYLHQVLRHLDPAYQVHLPRVRTVAGVTALEHDVVPSTSTPHPRAQARAATGRRLAQRVR